MVHVQDGKTYETEFNAIIDSHVSPSKDEWDPSIASTMPLQASTEPTGEVFEVGRYPPTGDTQTQAGVMGWLKSWVGIKPEEESTTYPSSKSKFPTKEDVGVSKLVDQSYGDPSAGILQPGGGITKNVTAREAINLVNKNEAMGPKSTVRKVTGPEAEKIHEAWLASEQSGLAKLGFSPGKLHLIGGDIGVSGASGAYNKKHDEIWWDTEHSHTPVHEAMHRGFNILLKQATNLIDESTLPQKDREFVREMFIKHSEEDVVRGLMKLHFGDQELANYRGKESDPAIRKFLNEVQREQDTVPMSKLKQLEDIAARHIAKKRPGGPR